MAVYPKKIKDKIAEGIKNGQTPQEILCKFILWQYSDIETALKKELNRPCTIENFLSVYMKIEIAILNKLLKEREIYKNVVMTDFGPCINCG